MGGSIEVIECQKCQINKLLGVMVQWIVMIAEVSNIRIAGIMECLEFRSNGMLRITKQWLWGL